MRNIRHIDSKNIPKLKPLLKKWIEVLEKYIAMGDLPWRYRERAQVGFFAAATWLSGKIALEEWSSAKGLEDAERKGRCDLWIDVGDYHIEAKHSWCKITGNPSKEKSYIQRTINSAIECAQHLKCDKNSKLAFTFLAPYYPIGEQESLDSDLEQWISTIHSIDYDAIAWLLPPSKKLKKIEGQNLGAGIVLLINIP